MRHPGYVGTVLQALGLPFLLGSLWALIPGITAVGLMIIRTALEDHTLELSHKYAASTTESQKTLLAAAGEAMLVRSSHGSLGVFIGFVLFNIGGLMMSFIMLTGKIFNKVTAGMGIAGSM